MSNTKENRHEPRLIPKSELVKGILECITRAERFVQTAQAIVRDHSYEAAILYSFGIEEFGKAHLLKKYESITKDMLSVDSEIFTKHQIKFDAANDNLPAEVFVIKGSFTSSFTDISYTRDTTIDLRTRWQHLYVDWINGKSWTRMPRVDVPTLIDHSTKVMEYIQKLKTEYKK